MRQCCILVSRVRRLCPVSSLPQAGVSRHRLTRVAHFYPPAPAAPLRRRVGDRTDGARPALQRVRAPLCELKDGGRTNRAPPGAAGWRSRQPARAGDRTGHGVGCARRWPRRRDRQPALPPASPPHRAGTWSGEERANMALIECFVLPALCACGMRNTPRPAGVVRMRQL